MIGALPSAMIFDVDGTLYRQAPLRRRVAYRLCGAALRRPFETVQTVRAVSAYRRAQEALRGGVPDGSSVAAAQLRLAAEWSSVPIDRVRAAVERWMESEPLALLPACAVRGLRRALEAATRRGIRLAACSDYPAAAKLSALGIGDLFETVVTAQDPEVQRFKPDPRGLEVTLERLAVAKSEALYVGDRPEVDAVAAARAGIRCVIIAPSDRLGKRSASAGTLTLDQLASLLSVNQP